MLLEVGFDRKQRRLGVERIEYRFHEQQIGAAFDQSVDSFGIRGDQLVVAHVAKARVVDVGRDRRRAVGRPQRPGDESRLVGRLRRPSIGTLACDSGRGEVDLAHAAFELVVGLRDPRRVEGIGLDDVGAGFQKLVVDLAHDFRPGEHQQVVVALQVVRVIVQPARRRTAIAFLAQLVGLDHGAHRPVQNEDTLLQEALEQRGLVGNLVHFSSSKNQKPVQLPPSGFPSKAALAAFVERPQARVKSALCLEVKGWRADCQPADASAPSAGVAMATDHLPMMLDVTRAISLRSTKSLLSRESCHDV